MNIETSFKGYIERHCHNFQRFKALKEQASNGLKLKKIEKAEKQVRTASLFFTSTGGASLILGLATSGLSLSIPTLFGVTSLILGDDFTQLAKKLESPTKIAAKVVRNFIAQKFFPKKETTDAFKAQLDPNQAPKLNRKQKAAEKLKKAGKCLSRFFKGKKKDKEVTAEKKPSFFKRFRSSKDKNKLPPSDEAFVLIAKENAIEEKKPQPFEKPSISETKVQLIAAAKKEVEKDTILLKLVPLYYLIQMLALAKKHTSPR